MRLNGNSLSSTTQKRTTLGGVKPAARKARAKKSI
jgi:hypothetical protein